MQISEIQAHIDQTKVTSVPIEELMPYARNSRTHDDWQIAKIAKSIEEFGFTNPVLCMEDGTIVAGHGRVMAAVKLNLERVPVIIQSHFTPEQLKAYCIADNQLALLAGWDDNYLASELVELEDSHFDIEVIGFDDKEMDRLRDLAIKNLANQGQGGNVDDADKGSLVDKFGAPPFTVLDGKQGYWQARKRAWLGLGIQSELGRASTAKVYWTNNKLSDGSYLSKKNDVSIFDPVLCELIYQWFSPAAGHVLDPFAGGSVRGIVACELGYMYTGVDLNLEQIEANRAQSSKPIWVHGDSRNVGQFAKGQYDMLFSCPPYGDLEVYSDDPADISTMDYAEFKAVYGEIIDKSVQRLKPDTFACFVVGDFRDKGGYYRNFVSDTIEAFLSAGCKLYNETVFLTPFNSLPIRASFQFSSGRKLAKAHQNILIFVKGDAAKAAGKCGDIVRYEFTDVKTYD